LQTINFESHSDQVGGSATFLIASNNEFYSTSVLENHIRASPTTPNGFQQAIYEPFNSLLYSILINDTPCQFKVCNDHNLRLPSVAAVIKAGDKTTPQLGYQIFDQDYPAPLPSTNQAGFFGALFGVTFTDPHLKLKFIRAISIVEYINAFGYNSSFDTAISKTLQNPCLLCQVIPTKTLATNTKQLQVKITTPMQMLLTWQAECYDLDLSAPLCSMESLPRTYLTMMLGLKHIKQTKTDAPSSR
jgi:hypothetical protein